MSVELFLYCQDRELQKKIRTELEDQYGIKIKKGVTSIDKIKTNYGVGIFLNDDELDDYEFKDKDIIITLEKVSFNEWLSYSKRNIEIIPCEDGYRGLVDYLEDNNIIDSSKSSNKKDGGKGLQLEETINKNKNKIITFYSPFDNVGTSCIAVNSANILKKHNPNQRVALLNLNGGYSSILDMVDSDDNIVKMETSGSSLGNINKDIYKDNKHDIHIITDSDGLSIKQATENSNIIGALIEIVNHFDIIVVDTNNILDLDKLKLFQVSSDILIVSSSRDNHIKNTIEITNKVLPELGLDKYRYSVIINKCDTNSFKNDVFKISSVIPYEGHNTTKKDKELYICELNSDVYNSILNMFKNNGYI